ncbi:threonine-phosphate decarboxylase [Roseobacter fucihabitans]|uniref:threonine-phosphate decarboxylase n=1 Tax=Roseobacter fucihabitans TaxID=1537242 RepID=UPI00292A4013|nr:threonine-phosphate decarboxylase [Roseobacter litoralis]
MTLNERDHGGGLDAAIARFGGDRLSWIDLSTGINPHPYPLQGLPHDAWTALPDKAALSDLLRAARRFWHIPDRAGVIAAPGASALIAQLPYLAEPGAVCIPAPTYNEHAAAFEASGWTLSEAGAATAQVVVHPNNPDGRLWDRATLPAPSAAFTVIDESFCDVAPSHSLIELAATPQTYVLKSFGKFWGLAGLRLGFIAGEQERLDDLRNRLGPWAVSGPALHIATQALNDPAWAVATRQRLSEDAARLDALMQIAGARVIGGTPLFRLYDVESGAEWQARLARHHIWTRTFPYAPGWLRLGLPHALHWPRVMAAFA